MISFDFCSSCHAMDDFQVFLKSILQVVCREEHDYYPDKDIIVPSRLKFETNDKGQRLKSLDVEVVRFREKYAYNNFPKVKYHVTLDYISNKASVTRSKQH